MSRFELQIATTGRGVIDLTEQINDTIKNCEASLCHIFVKHTSASLIITGNEDENLLLDIEEYLQKIIADENVNYRHNGGAFDVSAHIRSILTSVETTIPVSNSQLLLGKFQGIFLYEHRAGLHTRRLILTLL